MEDKIEMEDEQLILDETPINEELLKSIEEYTLLLNKIKYDFYKEFIQSDNTHKSDDIGSLYHYHAIYLQVLGYWIGILDHVNLNLPNLENTSQIVQDEVAALTQKTMEFYNGSTESRTLAYNVLLKKTTEDPYFFIRPENRSG